MTFWKGAGNSIGEGMGLLVNSFISRQDQLKQQQIQEEELARQRQQQDLDNQYRQQQATEQRRQWEAEQAAQGARDLSDQAYKKWQMGNVDTANASKDRSDYFDTYLRPAYNAGMEAAVGNARKYGPTLEGGKPNPQYDPAMYAFAQNQIKGLQSRMRAVSDAAANGEGFYDAGKGLLSYVGADDPHASPTTPQGGGQSMPQAPSTTGPLLPGASPTPASQFTGAAPTAPTAVEVQGPPVPRVAPTQGTPTATPSAPPQAGAGGPAAQPQATPTAPLSNSESPAPTQPQQQGPQLPQQLPATVQEIPPSQLAGMDDVALLRQYGQGGVEYARAARAEYEAQVRAQREAVRKSQVDFWGKAAQRVLDDKNSRPEQFSAASTVMALINLPTLTPEQEEQFKAAVQLLAPNALTAESWQAVLNTKDPAVILGALPMYRAQAPGVVEGFDDQALYNWLQADLDDKASSAFRNYAAGNKDNIDAGRTTTLLPLEVRAHDDKHDESVVVQANTVADTANTRQDTENDALDGRVKAFDLGVKQLAGIASSPLPWQRMAASNPRLWFQMKQNLNLTDEGLANLYAQAQYKYGLGIKGDELTNQLRASEIATDGARRGGIIADTSRTVQTTVNEGLAAPLDRALTVARTDDVVNTTVARTAELQPRLDLLNAQIREAELRGANTASLIRERDTLLPIKVGEGTARTALTWANVGQVQASIKNDRERTAAYITGVKGNYAVDMAQVGKLTADTALTRAKDPNDPLYNPVIAASKPGDPVAALEKRAGVFYGQAGQALNQARTLQTQIGELTKRATGVTGTVDLSRLSPEDRKKLDSLTAQRDNLFAQAQNARQKGDDVITNGMAALSPTGKATVAPGLPAAQQWAAQNVEVKGVPSDCAAIAGKYLNDLGLSIPTSNLSAGLESNAKKAGWTANPGGYQQGDLVVWTGQKYGLQKDGRGVGKHVGVIAGFDAQGNPMILDNPGKLADGSQGQTRVRAMSDPGNAVIYRSPQAGGLGAPPARPQAAARTTAAPTPAGDSYNGTSLPPRPKVAGQGPPKGLNLVGSAAGVGNRVMTWSWMQAQQIENPDAARAWLDRTAKGLLPKGTPAQVEQLKKDLADSLGW